VPPALVRALVRDGIAVELRVRGLVMGAAELEAHVDAVVCDPLFRCSLWTLSGSLAWMPPRAAHALGVFVGRWIAWRMGARLGPRRS